MTPLFSFLIELLNITSDEGKGILVLTTLFVLAIALLCVSGLGVFIYQMWRK